jgi:hypothetical protein
VASSRARTTHLPQNDIQGGLLQLSPASHLGVCKDDVRGHTPKPTLGCHLRKHRARSADKPSIRATIQQDWECQIGSTIAIHRTQHATYTKKNCVDQEEALGLMLGGKMENFEPKNRTANKTVQHQLIDSRYHAKSRLRAGFLNSRGAGQHFCLTPSPRRPHRGIISG